ncbi:Hypothetical_protein [Hexamita inflata]|uniref:Hypothetical_protein n=1 Tax=Hexamita inflata TaxID=28002 RepID=A0AA86NX64_9EUKA|nr:Hypothetical protein HINF_LOCUS15169 [Hexamita inflata]
MSQQKISRTVLPRAEQERIDDIIKTHVCHSLHLTRFEQQEAQEYQRNRTKLSRTFNWTVIDQQLGKSYATKSFAYKRFFDVILPNLLPSYPLETVIQIEKYIQEQVSSTPDLHEIVKSPRGVSDLIKKICKQTKDEFNLQGSDIYSYKKQVDNINNYIKNRINNHSISMTAIDANDLIVFQKLEEPQEYKSVQEHAVTRVLAANGETKESRDEDETQIFATSSVSELTYLTEIFEFSSLFE